MSASLWIAALVAAAQNAEELPPACTPWGLVFFETGSSAITPQASGILENLVSAVPRDGGTYAVTLRGHADRVGGAAANLRLSWRRAEAVRDHLIAYGVLGSRISVAAMGESSPLVATGDDVPERQNRFVEVAVVLSREEHDRREAIWARSGQQRPIC